MKPMTMRERIWAFARGREHDRIPFVQYRRNAAPEEEIWAALGRDAMGVLDCLLFKHMVTPNCRFVHEETTIAGKRGFRNTLITPAGNLHEERLIGPVLGSSAAASHYVKTPEDYQILLAYFRDMQPTLLLDPVREMMAQLGDDGVPHAFITRTPYQQLWIEWVDIQDLAVHMALHPDLVEEVMAVMKQNQTREFEMVVQAMREVPLPYLAFADNITAPMIGEALFREHCVPAYNELAGMLDEAGLDIPVYCHMDGDLRPLWDAIGESWIRGMDSMSPPPDNDTSVAEAMARWPESRICINFPSSVHLGEPEQIRQVTEQILAEGGHTGRLQIQISENMPPGVWRKSFPAILGALEAFGSFNERSGRAS